MAVNRVVACVPRALVIVAFAFLVQAARAHITAEDSAKLLAEAEPRIRAIYDTKDFAVKTFQAPWLPDGSGYMTLETAPGALGADIVSCDPATGKRVVLVSSDKLVVPGTSRRLEISDFVRSPAGNRFLLRAQTGRQPRWATPGRVLGVRPGFERAAKG